MGPGGENTCEVGSAREMGENGTWARKAALEKGEHKVRMGMIVVALCMMT